jgi:AraC-like DNA-binding protein/mannose-6-phosphate isomerase-like protein (cupin superfamily)
VTVPALNWQDAYVVLEPEINAEGTHTYPFDPSFPADVAFLVHAGRQSVRMNRHDYLEVLYVYAGNADVQILHRYIPVKRGELVLIGPNLYHRIINRPSGQLKLVSLNFQPEVVSGATPNSEDEEYLTPFFLQGSDFPYVVRSGTGIPGQVFELMRRIRAELPPTSTVARLSARTCMKMILLLLVKHYSTYVGTREVFHRRERDLERLRPLFEYLEAHYGQRTKVLDAARLCAMSNSHFMAFFRRVTGQSFLAYLNHFRITKAEGLLVSTEKSVAEVGQEVSFCDQAHFGKAFRKFVGMTPLAYRRCFGEAGKPGRVQTFKPETKGGVLAPLSGVFGEGWESGTSQGTAFVRSSTTAAKAKVPARSQTRREPVAM